MDKIMWPCIVIVFLLVIILKQKISNGKLKNIIKDQRIELRRARHQWRARPPMDKLREFKLPQEKLNIFSKIKRIAKKYWGQKIAVP